MTGSSNGKSTSGGSVAAKPSVQTGTSSWMQFSATRPAQIVGEGARQRLERRLRRRVARAAELGRLEAPDEMFTMRPSPGFMRGAKW